MTQATYTQGAGLSGTTYRTGDNSGKEALITCHKGSTAPSYAIAGMLWCDDGANPTWIYKQYDGTDWIEIYRVNTTTNSVTYPNVQTSNGSTNYAADGGSTDTYSITLSPAPSAYTVGMPVYFKSNTANTGACTINVNSLGAKTIKKKTSTGLSDLNDNDIVAGDINLCVYDGTYFQLMSSPAPVVQTHPPGVILEYAGTAAPDGWLLCYGQAISRTTYSNLFSIIGTQYGVGNGTTTFNIPDKRGRTGVGKDDMGGTAAGRVPSATSLGATGGEYSHTLTTDEIPSHSHNIQYTIMSFGGSGYSIWNTGTASSQATSSAGGGQAHNNMPPYFTANYIIKT